MIKDNILRLKEDIALICRQLGRQPQEVVLVGVTKYASASGIEEALQSGLEHIAENKIQEAKQKFATVDFSKHSVTRHMIGHLQTNKVKDALKLFDMIQSVDSLRLAEEIDRQAQKINRPIDCLVQVNTSGEAQKSGIKSQELFGLLEGMAKLKFLRVLGLMAMAPNTKDEDMIRKCFRDLRELYRQAKEKWKGSSSIQMNFLSMGMSNDYAIALKEGSNMLRIGSAIFKHA